MDSPELHNSTASNNFIPHSILFVIFQTIMQRSEAVNHLWTDLESRHQIPFRLGEKAAFLYRGNADSVFFHGDFDGWGGDKKMSSKAVKVGKSDVWILKSHFPAKARIDYKIFINNKEAILDPANKYIQWSGYGPNSELRMPGWTFPEITLKRNHITKGILSKSFSIESKNLGYTVNYRVYTPAGYSKLKKLPVFYVTDGQEYADPRLGDMITILNNLIAEKRSNRF